jgi:hypothetical protein
MFTLEPMPEFVLPVTSAPPIYVGLAGFEISNTCNSQPIAEPAVCEQAVAFPVLPRYKYRPDTTKPCIAVATLPVPELVEPVMSAPPT